MNGQSIAASAVDAEPRLQPRTTIRNLPWACESEIAKPGAIDPTTGDSSPERIAPSAGKPAARHLPVNGHSIAASAGDAEPRLQPRTTIRNLPWAFESEISNLAQFDPTTGDSSPERIAPVRG